MRPHAILSACAITLLSAIAGADEPAFTDTDKLAPPPPDVNRVVSAAPTFEAFSYVSPQRKHYLRAALEVSTVLLIGNVDYLLNTSARGGTTRSGDQRWDLHYDWPTFRSKLTGDLWKVDTNHFNTNYISHPFAGTMYYSAARANRLSPLESLGYTAVGALTWEMFGELREEVSVNDVIVTSSAGFVIGESLTQLSSFFYRSKKNLRNDALAALFSPTKAVNDWADGAVHARSQNLDRLGLTRDEWHRFEVFAGGGITRQRSGTYADERFGLDLHVINLPGYEHATHQRAVFDDGNVAQIHFESTLSRGRLADAAFAARIIPIGFYERSASLDGRGDVVGDGILVGMLATFEYSVHDFDRDRRRPLDLMTVLSPAGIVVEYTHQSGAFRARTRLELSGDFAGVTAYALDDYRVAHQYDDSNLQTVLKQEGYYHALGVSASPSLELGWGPIDIGGRVTLDSCRGLEGFDEQQQTIANEIPLADQRVDMRAWVGTSIPRTPIRLEVLGRQKLRLGQVGEVRAKASETSLYAMGSVVF